MSGLERAIFCSLGESKKVKSFDLSKFLRLPPFKPRTIDNQHKYNRISENPIYDNYLNSINNYWSFEGLIVALADEIAQRHHDIEDSLQYGVVTRNTIIEKLAEFQKLFGKADKKTFIKLKMVLILCLIRFSHLYIRVWWLIFM